MSTVFRSLRTAARPAARAARGSNASFAGKRFASGHGNVDYGSKSWSLRDDIPWVVGSAAIFGPMIGWAVNLVRNSSAHGEHHDSHGHHEHAASEEKEHKFDEHPANDVTEDSDVKAQGEDTDEPSSIKQSGEITPISAEDKSTARAREQAKDEAGGHEAPEKETAEEEEKQSTEEVSEKEVSESEEKALEYDTPKLAKEEEEKEAESA
ncbi:hypothetical protein [Phaffia rhodozyma]|uniref:Uncharacterized protein n=1 Tax=Phaffia rhodozyma TaxID=264483 RepID=A0A0F7SNX6_PHARH|nr:hypothetical protein [Phaffia rhodozyma]